MGTLFLTSTGLSDQTIFDSFQKLVNSGDLHTAAIVTTASEDKSNNKYTQLAQEQLESLGFKTTFTDLEEQPDFDFSNFDVIYVCGGNTFKHANETNFKSSIVSLLERNGIYVGVSAGTLILSPTIDIANEIDPDPNEIGLTDLTALNLVPFHIAVHFDESEEAEVAAFENKYNVKVERLSNSQAIIINENGDSKRKG